MTEANENIDIFQVGEIYYSSEVKPQSIDHMFLSKDNKKWRCMSKVNRALLTIAAKMQSFIPKMI